uniref:DNA adenine methylase n=1 Tax=Ezakiella massiliensis TaxID=1852374 RepID=UPI00094E623B|nr:DNA adenine methylase [Ezakiella massiliensis]
MARTNSPLRYPGGKTQLSQFLSELLNHNKLNNVVYAEPFSGGFGAGLELLYKDRVSTVIINDYDVGIYSVWYALLNENEKFIEDIKKVDINIEEWNKQKAIYNKLIKKGEYSYNLAFATYFLNRTNRSGIITGGPIGGKNQDSKYKLDCRFNKKTVIQKFLKIYQYKDRIKLYNLEANKLIQEIILNYNEEDIFIFFDPPYYEQGKNLYTNFFEHDNHIELKNKISLLDNYYWILTYDNKQEIAEIYKDYKKYYYSINYYAGKVREAKEILIPSRRTIVKNCENIKIECIS